MLKTHLPPAIVLVRPQMGENIGAAARAMSNFGLSDLRLVAPRDGWPNDAARRVAAGGEAIVDAAILYPDTASALSDIQIAFATTARSRDMDKRVVTPKQAVEEIMREVNRPSESSARPMEFSGENSGGNVKTAFIFGPERTGLENEDIALADAFLTIPTIPEHYSLNIAQSVVVLAYEWFSRTQQGVKNVEGLRAIATKDEYQSLFQQLESYLDEANFFRVEEKKPVMWNNTRTMLIRGGFSSQEIRTLRGIFRILWEGRNPRKNQEN